MDRTPHAARAAYDTARADAIAQFEKTRRVEPLWKALSAATDTLIRTLAAPLGLTVIAVGGYGRAQLFPHSDVDVLLLAPATEAQASQLLQGLWDTGVPASHAVRTVEETVVAAQGEPTIATALLDARLVVGEPVTFETLQAAFAAVRDVPRFMQHKLAERDARHARWGDSRFMLEPQIKEGKGSLRDFDTLRWIERYSGEVLLPADDWAHAKEAVLFFATLRASMHLLRKRADERLTFELQMELARLLKFPGRNAQQKAEALMQRYFSYTRLAGVLTRRLCARLEALGLRPTPAALAVKGTPLLPPGFLLEGGRIHFAPGALLANHARAVILFTAAAAHGLDIHPHAYVEIDRALPVLKRELMFEGQANRAFLALLTGPQPEQHLRRMNECGVLGALIPEFGRIAGMMQYDGYHTYTVDEHMLVAVGKLQQIESGKLQIDAPLSSKVMAEIRERAALYLAVLCHDLAKGKGGGHAEKGARVAAAIAQRMGIGPAGVALAGWLTAHQELLSKVAFKRNLDDPKTIADFVAIVQSPERLRLLLLLTVSDIMAVGPTIWNGWKGALIRELYSRAMAAMGIHVAIPEAQHLPQGEADLLAQWSAQPAQPLCVIQHDSFRAVSELTCLMGYTPTVFRNLAGVLAYLGASIVSARIQVWGEAALMQVALQDLTGHSFAEEEVRLRSLDALMLDAEAGRLDLAHELPRRQLVRAGREVVVVPAVFIDHHSSDAASLLEVNARDRLGLLYDLLGAFDREAVRVRAAVLATYGQAAVDVFYAEDAKGRKLGKAKCAAITRRLLAVCAGTVQDGAA